MDLKLDWTTEDIKNCLSSCSDFMTFLLSSDKKGWYLFTIENIPFIILYTPDNQFEIYLSTYYIGKLDPQTFGSFINDIKDAIKLI